MYAISNWARRHVMMARLLLTLLHICLFGAAWWAGQRLSFLSPLPLGLMAVVVLGLVWAAAFLKEHIEDRKWRWRVQKTRFFLTGTGCLLLLLAFFSTSQFTRWQLYGTLNGTYTEKADKKEKPDWNTYTDRKKYSDDLKAYFSSLPKKELRKELRQQLKGLREIDSGTKTGLIVLIALLTVIALLFVAALSCGIACNGNDALALVVLIGGGGGLIALAYFLIRRIKRGKKTAPATSGNPVQAMQPAAANPTIAGAVK